MLKRYLSCLTLCCLLSCKSSDDAALDSASEGQAEAFIPKAGENPLPAVASPTAEESAPHPCTELQKPDCAADISSVPYRCLAHRYDGKLLAPEAQLVVWASGPCQAKYELQVLACQTQLNPERLEAVSCTPDTSNGHCPIPVENCATTPAPAPTRCFAQNYKKQELAWTNRPVAWGQNACEAKQKLQNRACQLGLDPKELGRITCEPEPNPELCPPKWQECKPEDAHASLCTLNKIGQKQGKEPWTAIGMSLCEAQFRLQELACRTGSKANHLTAEEWGGMQCRGLEAGLDATQN